ncbi:MAG: integrase core domain-containing protein, partial [Pseudomonadota bacterium]
QLRDGQPVTYRFVDEHRGVSASGYYAWRTRGERPAAIVNQNDNRCSRRATGGRPGECRARRVDLPDRRFLAVIATSQNGVLRAPVESAQYAADDNRKALAAACITPSMSRKGNCLDNTPVESFFHTLKAERVHHRVYATRAEARRDLFVYIEGFYNSRRLHSGIGYRSPADMERMAA